MPVIVGLRGEVKDPAQLMELLKEHCRAGNSDAQLMRAEMIFGREHVLSAIEHAERAFRKEKNSSSSPAMETLLYASGERQISDALRKMGIRNGTKEIALVAFGGFNVDEFAAAAGLEWDDSVLEGDPSFLQEFGVSKKEMESVPSEKVEDLVLEKVAFVDLLK